MYVWSTCAQHWEACGLCCALGVGGAGQAYAADAQFLRRLLVVDGYGFSSPPSRGCRVLEVFASYLRAVYANGSVFGTRWVVIGALS